MDKNQKKKFFEIQRIYIKDVSFEAPKTPNIFHKEWNPIIKFDLNSIAHQLEKNVFEVILQVKVIVKNKKELFFLCDVYQAGIFFILNLKKDELKHCLGAYCPNILFPYARTCISTLVSYGSFPQLNLAPINFDDIFYKNLKDKID
ncbi:protein-export chaperone SecB [Buchnera aphidicola (Melanaphis sacchari)]|uniref:Protein-export protein SecB n=1 Tax=Buchnera aphidicola (Melanaphis sacchari) TaxID=2173854 RepID=A0A2U8DFX9_9GAMM|nr:protein-export chaperone SecB [Buchnera aphidicola]AWH90706.1 protein-export chaperone SecB [Buchnera aphidicola (Melanaphis sacchari)]